MISACSSVSKKHRMGNSPQAQVFENDNGKYAEVGIAAQHDYNGNVIIGSNLVFKGKVVLS